MFYDCIMNFSFVTELEPSLAQSFNFFADCCTKFLTIKEEDQLLEFNVSNNPQTVVILPPSVAFNSDDKECLLLENEDGLIFFKNSAFIYKSNMNITNYFPRLKIELGLNLLEKEELNETSCSLNSGTSENNDNIDENYSSKNIFSDNQSISSKSINNNFITFAKKNVPMTPIGVRTKAEKLQSHKVQIFLYFMTKIFLYD